MMGPATQTLDLNIPLAGSNAIVPIGLVNSRVSQLDANVDSSSDSMIETLKKQKRGYTPNARLAVAASSSPVGRHENIMPELLGSWVA